MRLMIAVLLTSITAFRAFGQDHVTTTIAGNGAVNNGLGDFIGDTGPAIKAPLSYPKGIAVDSAGNVYVADTGTGRVRRVSNGVITTVAGNGTLGFSGDAVPVGIKLGGATSQAGVTIAVSAK